MWHSAPMQGSGGIIGLMGLDSGQWMLLWSTLACGIPAGLPWQLGHVAVHSQSLVSHPSALMGRIALLHPSTHDTPSSLGTLSAPQGVP